MSISSPDNNSSFFRRNLNGKTHNSVQQNPEASHAKLRPTIDKAQGTAEGSLPNNPMYGIGIMLRDTENIFFSGYLRARLEHVKPGSIGFTIDADWSTPTHRVIGVGQMIVKGIKIALRRGLNQKLGSSLFKDNPNVYHAFVVTDVNKNKGTITVCEALGKAGLQEHTYDVRDLAKTSSALQFYIPRDELIRQRVVEDARHAVQEGKEKNLYSTVDCVSSMLRSVTWGRQAEVRCCQLAAELYVKSPLTEKGKSRRHMCSGFAGSIYQASTLLSTLSEEQTQRIKEILSQCSNEKDRISRLSGYFSKLVYSMKKQNILLFEKAVSPLTLDTKRTMPMTLQNRCYAIS